MVTAEELQEAEEILSFTTSLDELLDPNKDDYFKLSDDKTTMQLFMEIKIKEKVFWKLNEKDRLQAFINKNITMMYDYFDDCPMLTDDYIVCDYKSKWVVAQLTEDLDDRNGFEMINSYFRTHQDPEVNANESKVYIKDNAYWFRLVIDLPYFEINKFLKLVGDIECYK